jgi:serine/threonine-protein kinase
MRRRLFPARSDARLGEYKIERLLARGLRTDIYRALHEPSGTKVALRCLDPRRAQDPIHASQAEDHFRAELDRVLPLQGPSIPTVLDGGVTDGILWLATELKRGQTLAIPSGRISYIDALGSTMVLVDALLVAYRKHGLVHGDLRPNSVQVDAWEEANVHGVGCAGLFGISRSLARVTPLYRAPEQLKGDAPVDVRSDIYSFGMILYALLAGRPPFADREGRLPDKAALVTIAEHGGSAFLVPLPKLLGPNAEVVWKVIQKATHPDPDKRIESWSQVRAEVGGSALFSLGKSPAERRRAVATLIRLHDRQGTGAQARAFLANAAEHDALELAKGLIQ